jgi:hypothetical protein
VKKPSFLGVIAALFLAFGLAVGQALTQAGRVLEIRPRAALGNLPFHNRAERRENGFKPGLIGQRVFNGSRNTLKLPTFIHGHRLLNSNGDIDPSSTGYQYVIDTLSFIRSRVIEQKFYQVPIADFFPVDVGEAAWSDEIVQNLVFLTGGGFFDGDMDQGQGGERLASVDAALAPVRMPVQTWAKGANWTIMEIAMAAAASKWDAVSSKLESLKKDWDLGIQQVGFLGHPSRTSITGLLNNPAVTINTSLLPTPISKFTSTQYATFVATVLGAYFANSNSTELPNRLVIAMSDYLGLATPIASGFPIRSQLSYLLEAFREMCGPDFEIKGLAYSQAVQNASAGIGKQRAVLYRDDPDTLSMSIPVDLTMLEAKSTNGINWQQASYAQYSGVLITRPREVLYMDVQSS